MRWTAFAPRSGSRRRALLLCAGGLTSAFACAQHGQAGSQPTGSDGGGSSAAAPASRGDSETTGPAGASTSTRPRGDTRDGLAPASGSAQQPPAGGSAAGSSGGEAASFPASESSDDRGSSSAAVAGTSGAAGGAGSIDASHPEPDAGPASPEARIAIVGRELYVDGKPFQIRGVNWNPIPRGATHPDGLDFAGFAEQDIALMKAAGVNAVRTYERLEDRAVLDQLYEAGIYVFSTVYGWWQDDPSVVTERVEKVKDHPAILAWVIGNEWNYNHLYGHENLTLEQTRDQLNQAAALIRAADDERPVSTIYGELGSAADGSQIEAMLEAMPDIDLWGINAYRGIDHSQLFDEWAAISDKPMYLGEYGADAWDSRGAGQLNVEAQAEATRILTQQIIDRYAGTDQGVTLGGFIFEWADEWWKDGAGSPDVHDTGGAAPGGGPHPDQVFNEEYWGIVDIDRNLRPAYEELRELYLQ